MRAEGRASMKVFLLGLDGATWDTIRPMITCGDLPNFKRLRDNAVSGVLHSVFPPLSPVAWTAVMTGKNSGKHGVFEFLEHEHDPLGGRVNSSRSIRSELLWEIAARHGKKAVVGGVPLSYPYRGGDGFFLGDFLSPPDSPDFTNDPEVFRELEAHLGKPYRPWATVVHDGGHEADVLADLTDFLDQHLKAVEFLVKRCPWDLFVFDLMATDRIQHELWHVFKPWHTGKRGRHLPIVCNGFIKFWRMLDEAIGRIEAALPPDAAMVLMSDHGFGPITHYVNFNVWLLQQGFIALQDTLYVKQKRWFWERGISPQWLYGVMTRLGLAGERVRRFRGRQIGFLEDLAQKIFLSRRHIDWSRTRAYAQGNFGQVFVNLKGRQPQGCVDPADYRAVVDELKAGLMKIEHPEKGGPLIERIYERDDLYQGPYKDMAPDLTVVPGDWCYRTIGLHDFTTNRVITDAFGPTGDHRMEGVFIGTGKGFRPGARMPDDANLFDIAPTVLHLLGVPVPEDMDGRVLLDVLDPTLPRPQPQAASPPDEPEPVTVPSGYTEEEDAAIQQRLADLGYL
jgi:predicted AlkP superfamily phosphohydrolase/phosphomutase